MLTLGRILWNIFYSFHGVKFICVSFKKFMVVVFMVTTFIWYHIFFKVTCKFFDFFMVIGINFLDHRCHFSWLQVYYFMVTCYHKMCNAQVKKGNNTICTSIVSWCSFHDVKSTNVKFSCYVILSSHVEDLNFQLLQIPFLLVKGVIFHGDMIPQNLQPINERKI
jgi:hypothetical protein